jgi:hypothetical protein
MPSQVSHTLDMKTKVVPIKNDKGEIIGYQTLFWTKQCGWVCIPEGDFNDD